MVLRTILPKNCENSRLADHLSIDLYTSSSPNFSLHHILPVLFFANRSFFRLQNGYSRFQGSLQGYPECARCSERLSSVDCLGGSPHFRPAETLVVIFPDLLSPLGRTFELVSSAGLQDHPRPSWVQALCWQESEMFPRECFELCCCSCWLGRALCFPRVHQESDACGPVARLISGSWPSAPWFSGTQLILQIRVNSWKRANGISRYQSLQLYTEAFKKTLPAKRLKTKNEPDSSVSNLNTRQLHQNDQ